MKKKNETEGHPNKKSSTQSDQAWIGLGRIQGVDQVGPRVTTRARRKVIRRAEAPSFLSVFVS